MPKKPHQSSGMPPPGRLSPRRTGILTHRPHDRSLVACLTSARRHRPCGPIAHQDRRPQTRHTASVGIGKINSNCAQTTDGQTVSPSPNLTVTSHRRPVLEGETATQIMSSWPKTHPQSRLTRQTSQGTSANWRRCTRYQKGRSTPSPDQRCFYPTSDKLKILEIADADTDPPENL